MIYGYWLMEICIPSISHPKTLKSNIYFLAQRNPAGVFHWMLQDGLQSLRGMSDGNDMLSAQAYSPYGEPMFTDMPTEFGFTGEQTDPLNDLVYLRARYLNPKLGIFGSLDPFEGDESEPLTWNGYGWVEGNTPNLTDASGMCPSGSGWDWIIKISQQLQAVRPTQTPTEYPQLSLAPTPPPTEATVQTTPPYSPSQFATATPEVAATNTPTPMVTQTPTPPPATPRNPAFDILSRSNRNIQRISYDPRVLVVGWRVDASLVPVAGNDVNLELQIVPHHLLPEYWGKRYVAGVMLTHGPEFSTSIGVNVTTGPIVGYLDSSSIGSQSRAGENITFGGGKLKLPLLTSPVAEGDIGSSESGWVAYISLGADTGSPLPVSGYVGSFNSISVNDAFSEWACSSLKLC